MAGRQGAVQVPVAQKMQLPAQGIVKRMHTGIAPVPTKIGARTGRGAAGKLKQLFRCLERDFRGQHLGLGYGDRGAGAAFGRDGCSGDFIQQACSTAKDGLCRVDADL